MQLAMRDRRSELVEESTKMMCKARTQDDDEIRGRQPMTDQTPSLIFLCLRNKSLRSKARVRHRGARVEGGGGGILAGRREVKGLVLYGF
ncbi:unnamed protein product [Linum trigynum]|uniref:Uncharacterized protein n=1 Tax=Linum trigynum TaxID=586398 RepID=A0AAV2E554_9ROSI